MGMSALEEPSSWTNFLRAISNEETAKSYSYAVKRLMRFAGIDNSDALLKGTDESLENLLMDFIAAQKKGGITPGLVRVWMSGIKKFYKHNRKKLDWDLVSETIGRGKKTGKDRAYSREQIAKALIVADLREQVIIYGAASTGIRRGAFHVLKKKDHQLIPELGIYRVVVYAGEEEEYVTFSTPEYRQAVDEYFAYRERCGEKISDNSWLLRTDFDANDPVRVTRPRGLKAGSVSDIMERLMVRAGVRQKVTLTVGQKAGKIRHDTKIMHGFRKFYDTQMSLSGVSELWTQMLEGHKVGLKGSYFRPSDHDLLYGNDKMRGYADAIDSLTIDESKRLQKKVQTLEKEKSAWEKKVEQLDDVIAKLEKKGLL